MRVPFRTALLLFLLTPFSLLSQTADFTYDHLQGGFRVTKLTPPKNGTSEKKPARWLLFMEFGDGHYAILEQDPREKDRAFLPHRYQQPGAYAVTLRLTPLYAVGLPPAPKTKEIVVNAGGGAAPTYEEPDPAKRVNLITNVNKEVIAKHEIRVAVHHQNPAARPSGGYLVFLYNHFDDNGYLNFDPFTYREKGEGLYYKNAGVPQLYEIPRAKLEEALPRMSALVGQKINGYSQIKVFRSDNLSAGEERRLFLSVTGNANLDYANHKNSTLRIGSLWLPDGVAFDERRYFDEYLIAIEKVHDPNRIEITPKVLVYRKHNPKEVTVAVRFRNKGKGAAGVVKRAFVELAFSQDLNLDSVGIDGVLTSPVCEECPPGFDADRDRCISVEALPPPRQNVLLLTFHNIGLARKGEGLIVFRLKTRDTWPENTNIDGTVTFDGAEPDPLSRARPRWRHKTIQVETGYQPFSWIKGFDLSEKPAWRNLTGGISFQNAPLGTGFSLGFGLRYAGFQFDRAVTYTQDSRSSVDYFRGTESFRLHNLYLEASGGYQFTNAVRIRGTAGLVLPAFAETTLEGELLQNNEPYVFPAATSRFGLFQKHTTPPFANRPLETTKTWVGFRTGLGVEFGNVHFLTGGLRTHIDFFPTFYAGDCARIGSTEVYLRFRLGATGGKHP